MSRDTIDALLYKAEQHFERGEYVQAESLVHSAHGISDASTEQLALSKCIRGECARSTARFDEAINFFHDALRDAEAVGNLSLQSRTVLGISTVAEQRGDNRAAQEEAVRSLSLAVQAGDELRQGAAQLAIGNAHMEKADYALAREYFDNGLAHAEQHGSRYLQTFGLEYISILHLELGEPLQSFEYMHKAQVLARQFGFKKRLFGTSIGLGNIYRAVADYPRALDSYAQALVSAEELADKVCLAVALHNIGGVYSDTSDTEKAIHYMQRALAINEEVGRNSGIANCLGNIGAIYCNLGEHGNALVYLTQSYSLCEKFGNRAIGRNCLLNIADIHRATGKFDEAALGYRELLADLPTDAGKWMYEASALRGLGSTLLAQGKRKEGLAHLQQALRVAEKVGDKREAANVHKYIAEQHALAKRGDKAYHHMLQHLELEHEIAGAEVMKKIENFTMQTAIANAEKEKETEIMKRSQLERELANTTLQLVAHTNRLAEFRDSIRAIMWEMPPSEAMVRELNEKLKDLATKSIDWIKYDEQFKAAYPEFTKKLVETYPALSSTEVRICSFVRMNLKSEDIARLFSLSERTVENHRNHIRKKMNLRREDDLALTLAKL